MNITLVEIYKKCIGKNLGFGNSPDQQFRFEVFVSLSVVLKRAEIYSSMCSFLYYKYVPSKRIW